MAPPPTGTTDRDGSRTLNILVIVALVSMLAGTILLITARDPGTVTLAPGDDETVFLYEAPTWDPWDHPMEVVIYPPANFTLVTDVWSTTDSPPEDETGREEVLQRNLTANGTGVRWFETAQPGEAWTVHVTNHGDTPIRMATEVACYSYYYVGGALVAFGLLGFVFYKLGMARGD